MVLWDRCPPSSRSAGFPNKVSIHRPNNLSLNLLACRVASHRSLDLVTGAVLIGVGGGKHTVNGVKGPVVNYSNDHIFQALSMYLYSSSHQGLVFIVPP